MKSDIPVGVTSRSFSKHAVLRTELLERYSDVRFNDAGISFDSAGLVDFARDRERLITGLESIDGDVLEALPKLEVISKYGVGMDMLDLDALARRGVRLGWMGGVNRQSVAELALGMALSLLRHVPALSHDVRNGGWHAVRGRQLQGRRVGIIGCGYIGKQLIRLLQPFGCQVLAHDILSFPEFYETYDVEPAGLEELLRSSEVVSLHVPLDESTRGMLNAERLALLDSKAVLINTARGGIVDEDALAEMLASGRLAGAGFDVFATEPPEGNPLLGLQNFLPTPHIGGGSEEAVLAMGRAAIRGLEENAIPTRDRSGD